MVFSGPTWGRAAIVGVLVLAPRFLLLFRDVWQVNAEKSRSRY